MIFSVLLERDPALAAALLCAAAAAVVLVSAAITVVFTRGSIFDPLRARGPELWRDLAKCPLCVGVWVGGGAAAAGSRLAGVESAFLLLFLAVALGSLTGCLALLFVRVSDWLESSAVAADAAAEKIKSDEKLIQEFKGQVMGFIPLIQQEILQYVRGGEPPADPPGGLS